MESESLIQDFHNDYISPNLADMTIMYIPVCCLSSIEKTFIKICPNYWYIAYSTQKCNIGWNSQKTLSPPLALGWIIFRALHIINSLWLSDTQWWQSTRSTLAQIMALCLMVPSFYFICMVTWLSSEGIIMIRSCHHFNTCHDSWVVMTFANLWHD